MKFDFMFKGKKHTDCSREELIELLSELSEKQSDMIEHEISWRTERNLHDIKMELKIKNDVIERLINK